MEKVAPATEKAPATDKTVDKPVSEKSTKKKSLKNKADKAAAKELAKETKAKKADNTDGKEKVEKEVKDIKEVKERSKDKPKVKPKKSSRKSQLSEISEVVTPAQLHHSIDEVIDIPITPSGSPLYHDIEGDKIGADCAEEFYNSAWKTCSERFHNINGPISISLELRNMWLRVIEAEGFETDLPVYEIPEEEPFDSREDLESFMDPFLRDGNQSDDQNIGAKLHGDEERAAGKSTNSKQNEDLKHHGSIDQTSLTLLMRKSSTKENEQHGSISKAASKRKLKHSKSTKKSRSHASHIKMEGEDTDESEETGESGEFSEENSSDYAEVSGEYSDEDEFSDEFAEAEEIEDEGEISDADIEEILEAEEGSSDAEEASSDGEMAAESLKPKHVEIIEEPQEEHVIVESESKTHAHEIANTVTQEECDDETSYVYYADLSELPLSSECGVDADGSIVPKVLKMIVKVHYKE